MFRVTFRDIDTNFIIILRGMKFSKDPIKTGITIYFSILETRLVRLFAACGWSSNRK